MTRTATRRVVSLWLPRLATERLSRRRSAPTTCPAPSPRSPAPAEPTAAPHVTVAPEGGALRLAAVDLAAQLAGLFPGQSLADARALEPGLIADNADPVSDQVALAGLATWCGRYTPWTSIDGLEPGGAGGLWLDITGCAHLFAPGRQGEEALLDDLVQRCAAAGYSARVGLADTPGAAWAAARFAGPGRGGVCIVPTGVQQDFLAPLPIAALRLPADTVAGLDRLGLRHIGDLLALPRTGLARRFGEVVTRRLDQALGRVAEPISPHTPAPSWRVCASFAEPLGEPTAVLAAAQRLTETLCARLFAADRGARRLELDLYRVGGGRAIQPGGSASGRVDTLRVGTSRPSRDPSHLLRVLREQLDRLPEPSQIAELSIEFMTLTAVASEPLSATQSSCLGNTGDTGGLDQLIDRLAARLGSANVMRFAACDSHLPERAQAVVPALKTASDAALGCAIAVPAYPHPPRPPRLLPRPEPVSAIAPVPDDPPALLRWRHHAHRIVRAEGPERLAPEWWRAPPSLGSDTRDYYRVEDAEGRRFWLYRDGLYGSGSEDNGEAASPRWYLHGFFG